ncbi:MAG TPA: DUF4345 family protein [Lacipirellulaceae bacterium]|nr:DUF4345 family protein [Lacipirellulaceae bacterium]
MVERIFLAVMGLLYAGLATWCAVAPAETSATVGFELKGGSGRSEFLTVYGGLELGLALIFLLPAILDRHTRPAVLACLIIHACLVATRSVSFVMFDGISASTYKLAVGEWVIFLASLAVWWRGSR